MTLYTSDTCKYCTEIKAKLEQKVIAYTEKNISNSTESRDYLVNTLGIRAVPVLETDSGDTLVGSDNIKAHLLG